jgi:hypothetical protein
MKILIFTEGIILSHKNAAGHDRSEISGQVVENEPSINNFADYIPIGSAVEKISKWAAQGAEIVYLTSRETAGQINDIRSVLKRYGFPAGVLEYRKQNEQYKDVAERVMPDVLIEDDCESIGGEQEMTYPHINPKARKQIKSIPVKEFGGIDHLPDDISLLSDLLSAN